MSKLDEKMEELKKEFDTGSKSRMSPEANRLHSKISRAKKKGDMTLVKLLAKEARRIPSTDFNDPNFKKLSYIRYADD